ncbi:hypothetical protein RhiirA1_482769 [Rhizophagus irregularis]|uniref:Uncharacterized protein n=1 Tax=Rhizophagus irregularis TaxID=588596 RepID=A0A2N0QLE4_9GLOM|nr:hypothetical protein RhiirA1_482769 [Rhizophagus irregularis]
MPSKETNNKHDPLEPINQVSSAILLARQQHEDHLRKRAVEFEEDPDMCGYAKEVEEDPKKYMDMTVRKRLIGEEIIRHSFEKDGITSFWLDTDEKWKKTVSTLQKNGMLW